MKAEAPAKIPFHIHQFHFLSLDAEFQPPPPSPLLLFAPRVDLSTASLSPSRSCPLLPASPPLLSLSPVTVVSTLTLEAAVLPFGLLSLLG